MNEFAMLARQGYPMNDLLRMAGADYDVFVICPVCGKGHNVNTGDENAREVCSDVCQTALDAART